MKQQLIYSRPQVGKLTSEVDFLLTPLSCSAWWRRRRVWCWVTWSCCSSLYVRSAWTTSRVPRKGHTSQCPVAQSNWNEKSHEVTQFKCTVKIKSNGTDVTLWSKMLIFKRTFHNLKVLTHLYPAHNFYPLIRALKWGTIWGFSLRGIRMAKG